MNPTARNHTDQDQNLSNRTAISSQAQPADLSGEYRQRLRSTRPMPRSVSRAYQELLRRNTAPGA